MNFPEELKYSQTDEWVRVENGIATIGISDYAQDALGDIVYFEFSVEAGDQVKAGDQLGQVDSAKASSEVNLPVSGVVTRSTNLSPTMRKSSTRTPTEKPGWSKFSWLTLPK